MTVRLSLSAIVGAAATILAAACGSDSSTSPPPPPAPTGPQLAMHFDTLAGQLQQSSPGDIRIQWYQEMVRVLARGVNPSDVSMRLDGGPAFLQMVTEVDRFPSKINTKLTADSTYILAGWGPALRPTQFIDARVFFLPDSGHSDTTGTRVIFYVDTLGHQVLDTAALAGTQLIAERGACQLTQLTYLSVETNPCERAAVEWTIVGGIGLIYINPQVQISGVHLTP